MTRPLARWMHWPSRCSLTTWRCARNLRGVEAQRAFFAVHEVAGGAAIRHGIGGGDEGQGGNQDFVAGFDAGQFQGDVQGGGSVDYGHGMSCPGEGCQIGLEAIDEFANGGNKGAVQAFLQIGPFVPGKTRFVQGHRA
jgi:hypothetical protein